MPIQPDRFIQCQSDGYIALRTKEGDLIGCIPGTPPQEDFIQTPIGSLSIWACVIYCAIPTAEQAARLPELPGFIAADTQSLDLARPITQDDQSDIGEPV